MKKQKDTSTALLEYHSNIVYVRLKEKSDFNSTTLQEQFNAQQELVGHDTYGVLVDGSRGGLPDTEARKLMAKHNPANRKATAIVTGYNAATRLIANFYIVANKPSLPTRFFRKEAEAIAWLKEKLKK